MKASDLLECQRDLARRLQDEAFLYDLLAKVADQEGVPLHSGPGGAVAQWAQNLAAGAANAVHEALVYDVVKPMVSLTGWEAQQYNGCEVFDADSAPTDFGLIRFDGGFELVDPAGNPTVIDWMLWHPTEFEGPTGGPGWVFLGWRDATTHTSSDRPSGHEDRWDFVGTLTGIVGQEFGPAVINGEKAWDPQMPGRPGVGNAVRFFHALWSLMRQPVVSLQEERIDRATGKRMQRAQLPGQVTVVTLRHLVQAGDARGSREWQNHWIVRGHYRRQAYGPGRRDHKTIFIAPHVKGNQDGPLLETEKVHRLVR